MAATREERAAEHVWTVVVGGGTGRRFGGPKQYEALGDRRVIDHAVATAAAASEGVVVVLPPSDAAREGAVAGGATRTESVRNGLAAVPPSATIVCVHDGARPFASEALYRAVVAAVADGADGAVPGVPIADTIKIITDSSVDPTEVVDTPPRARLVAVQTPQAFRADTLRTAYAAAAIAEATDDATLVEHAGGRVVVVPGDVDNRKITHVADLDWARSLIGASS
ncbi:MAG: 2-C-methyl-D-erythritol 4-phosphate cytidylyltransferase [Ilumatobacteraceae bacterium]